MERDKHYFAGDHTAKGFYPLYSTNFQELDLILNLTGSSNFVKTAGMKKLAEEWKSKGYGVEWIHCSSNNDLLDGIIFPQLKIGVYDSTCGTIENETASTEINVNESLKTEALEEQKTSILNYHQRINRALQSAHQSFKTGLFIHDDLEEIYINNMDFMKADKVANELINHLFNNSSHAGKTSQIKHRFFGASTPNGVIDYIPNLTDNLDKRYFIKGRAGTGKSTLLKKIAAAAEDLGLDVEIYHCGFDPESLDMIIVRELNFCIFDSTDPHEYFPEKEGDEIIDLYEKIVTSGTDEKYKREISKLTTKYKSYMKKGGTFLKKAKRNKEELDQIYMDAMDSSITEEIFYTMNENVQQQASVLD
ncbi:PRK06851 family protein [Alteribacillus bidgolensis]|uniref:Uncharacterized protein n=1 Tax=Alteribacillus bidgolensis TaxID=930129 RepID=A0A1G8MRA4_9BACI|nr:PRK06851 family protein [Alteribacillus bidgolensis]SDI70588.1 hypothetical protein SAMN05216352_110161 [Alteribacillus bidgolensis]